MELMTEEGVGKGLEDIGGVEVNKGIATFMRSMAEEGVVKGLEDIGGVEVNNGWALLLS